MKKMPVNRFSVLLFTGVGLALFQPFPALAQDSISLDYCYRQAEQNYPLRRQLGLLDNSSALRTKNIGKSYLPQVNVNGGVSLQSAVTEVAIVLPKGLPEISMPTLSKDWYKVTLDVNQAIYDGRVSHYQKLVEDYTLKSDRKGVEIELYKLKDRINQLYFGILLLQQNAVLLNSNLDRITAKLKEVQSAVRNGSAIEMNASLLEAELVKIGQQLTETRMDRASYLQMLAELTGVPVTEKAVLAVPQITLPSMAYENKRLESELFDIERARVSVMQSMVTTKWNPRLFAYGQVGYGRPSLNMLDDAFLPWWLVGAKFTWTPWNWNANKNEKKILSIQGDMLKSQQETFDKNLRISSEKDLGEIMKVAELIISDGQAIALREKITRAASSQLDNGAIQASDYIARLNEETLARLNLEIHKIQLIKAKLSYLYTLGKL